jgi:hypothetical protein
MGATERHALVLRVTEGRASSSNDLALDEMEKIILAVKAIRNGKAELLIDEKGWAQVVKT